MTIQLRDFQGIGVGQIRDCYRDGSRAPLFVLPTGGGKTFTFCYIASSANARGNRVLILVHRVELLRQSSDSLSSLGVRHGLIAPNAPMRLQELTQVASVQTLVRRLDELARAGWAPDLIVIDEAHHAVAGTWKRVLDHWPDAKHLGVTATPCRRDGKGLGVHVGGAFDAMVQGPQIGELIDRGYLAPPVVYAPPVIADLAGIKSQMGDFAAGDLAERMDKPTVTGDAVEHYGRICPGVPAIAFCVSVAHAEHVAEQFAAAGWRAKSLDGGMTPEDRKRIIADLAEGRLDVLTSCDIVSEGTDIPVVGCAILLRPTQSLGLYLQQVGRVLRLYAGKSEAIILDHVGNWQRHGLPDDPREWSLDGAKRKRGKRDAEEGPPPPLTCEGCFRQIRRPTPRECPHCGKSLKSENDRMDALQQVDGQLQRVTSADAERQRRREAAAASAARKAERGEVDKMTMQELVMYGQRKGYSNPSGWAWRVMSKRGANKTAATA